MDRAEVAATAWQGWRSFKVAAWLGWQIESNWTTPFVFAVYSIAKPIAMAGILVAIYATATGGDFASPMFASIYVGNAFYLYVGAVMTGMAYAVLDDRERYRMLKSVYVAPVDIRLYLIGRGVARFATGSIAVAITMACGIVFLHINVNPSAVNWPLFVAALMLGIIMLASLGLMLTGPLLLMGHLSWSIGEAVASALFLFSGAIFPLEVLPRALRPIGLALPLTYWFELLRRSLIGEMSHAFPTLGWLSDRQLLGVLGIQAFVLGAVTLAVFSACDRAARERGLIDRTTNY